MVDVWPGPAGKLAGRSYRDRESARDHQGGVGELTS